MQKKLNTVVCTGLLLAVAGTAQAAEIGVGLPDATIYYHDVTKGKTEYRIGATLGTPTAISAHYRAQIKQVEHLFWEAGLSFGTGGGTGLPLSLGYRLQLQDQLALEPLLTLDAMNSTTGFGINLAYKL